MRRNLNINYYMDLDLYGKGERIFNDIYNNRYIGKKYVINKKYGCISPSYVLRLRDVLDVSEKNTKVGIMDYSYTSICYRGVWLLDLITFTCPDCTIAPLNYLVYDQVFKIKLQLSGLLPDVCVKLINIFETECTI